MSFQGRKESWFIPTKLATNLSMSLMDSSSRKQVRTFHFNSNRVFALVTATNWHIFCILALFSFIFHKERCYLFMAMFENIYLFFPQGFVVVETNFRLYAYSTSKLHCEILRLFARYANESKNLFFMCVCVFLFGVSFYRHVTCSKFYHLSTISLFSNF